MLNFYIKEKENKMMNNETGRSMVEMLGVLAIIGVLSVGGIAGYTMAMNKYRANEILNTASMMVVLAKSANGGTGATINGVANAGLTNPYGSVDLNAIYDSGNVTIDVSGVGSTDVCNAVSAAASNDANLYLVNSCS